jgi:hypothetical protein
MQRELTPPLLRHKLDWHQPQTGNHSGLLDKQHLLRSCCHKTQTQTQPESMAVLCTALGLVHLAKGVESLAKSVQTAGNAFHQSWGPQQQLPTSLT